MADFSNVREMAGNENIIIHRGLVIFTSLLAGVGITFSLFSSFQIANTDTSGIVGFLTMGKISSFARLQAVLVLTGGLIGAIGGYWLWLLIAQTQRRLGHIPVDASLKRGAVPYVLFLAYLTYLYQGRVPVVQPLIIFTGITIGFFLLALLERRDKRKIFFAHPTEKEYIPMSIFIHGGILTLGAGVGWFIQSLPQVQPDAGLPGWGLWFVLGVGILVWIGSQLLVGVLNIFYSKQTFAQVYLAVAFALMPLALLPLQTIGVLQYVQQGRVLSERVFSWLPLVLVGVTGLTSLTILAINLVRLKRRKPETSQAGEELFRALLLIIAIPLLIYAAGYSPRGMAYTQPQLVGTLDLYQEGESLSAAQATLMGRLPFKEILLRHGFLTDVTSGLAAINWFGNSVESYRLLLILLAPLGLVAIYLLAIFCLPWLWALLITLTILTGHLGTVPVTRFFFPVISFIFTLYFIQRIQWPILILSGLLTALSLIASFTAGLVAVVGHVVLLVCYIIFGSDDRKQGLVHFVVYLGATVLGLMPWWLYLAMSGSLNAYFTNFNWVLAKFSWIYGLPLPGLGENPGIMQIMQFAMPPLAIMLGVLTIVNALRTVRETGFLPWNVLLLTTLTGLFWLRYLNRSNEAFLRDVLPVTAMLLAFFIYRLSARRRVLRGIILSAFLPALFIPQAGKTVLPELAGSFGMKNRICVDGLIPGQTERLRKTYMPVEQAEMLNKMTEYLEGEVGTAETYYDFSNQPLLYYLVPRRPVVRSLSTAGLATFAQQLQAIRNIEHANIKAVIFQGQPLAGMALDGIPSVVRQYAVSEYLLQKFVPVQRVGKWVIFVPSTKDLRPDPKAVAALKTPIELHKLPAQWGALGKYDPGQGDVVTHFMPQSGAQAVTPAGVTITVTGTALQVAECAQPIRLSLNPEKRDRGNVLILQCRVPLALENKTAYLSWEKAGSQNRIAFTLIGDSQSHCYAFRVNALPIWIYADEAAGTHDYTPLQLNLEMPGGGWTWESTTLLRVQDIPELARKQPGTQGPAQP